MTSIAAATRASTASSRVRGARRRTAADRRAAMAGEVGGDEQLLELLVVGGRQRWAERPETRRQKGPGPPTDPTPDARLLGRARQPAWAVLAARVAGLRMSSSRTETRCDEPLSSRWMP